MQGGDNLYKIYGQMYVGSHHSRNTKKADVIGQDEHIEHVMK